MFFWISFKLAPPAGVRFFKCSLSTYSESALIWTLKIFSHFVKNFFQYRKHSDKVFKIDHIYLFRIPTIADSAPSIRNQTNYHFTLSILRYGSVSFGRHTGPYYLRFILSSRLQKVRSSRLNRVLDDFNVHTLLIKITS